MSSASSEFVPLVVHDGLLLRTPSEELWGVKDGARALPAGSTHFGLLVGGEASIAGTELLEARLRAPGWFVLPGPARIAADRALVLTVPGYRGLPQLGAGLEPQGRLRYIDGCSDTLLVCPPRVGEPCLNHLHIPPHTRQTAHHHPSVRLGAIARGSGWCVTEHGRHRLEAGLAWHIPAGLVHAFHTEEAALDVLAWHPDSDFGPRDEDHPMINRTLTAPAAVLARG